MSEAAQSMPMGFTASAFGDGPSAGTLLRQAREAAGLHVAALAVSLKVPVRKLEALEQDRLDLLPDPVFVRALAASVCRTLKCDPQPVLDRLPPVAADWSRPGRAPINAPFHTPRDGAPPAWFRPLLRPGFLAVAALLAAALVLALLPRSQLDNMVTMETARPDLPVAAAPVAAGPAAPSLPSADAVVSAPALQPASTDAPSAQAATATTAPSGEGLVVFRATAPSWVEVSDARGGVPLRKLLAAGETAQTSGTLPLKVTVGNANVTEVQVRGQRFDLAPFSRDNVARFEVK